MAKNLDQFWIVSLLDGLFLFSVCVACSDDAAVSPADEVYEQHLAPCTTND